MKRLFFLLAGVIAAFTSCKKDRTCTCTASFAGIDVDSESFIISDVTKKEGKEKCQDREDLYQTLIQSYSYYGLSIDYDCELD